ncbi:unnamed protein product [Moneuplotes crassus]|uniref:Uncharacterized protein n=1 Tax=Euplotes crassus TaxID=5936 RepID=A0AAD1XWK8_EUPCR|nr:unnamed protein product [Moneuplotes crassus]
MGGNICSICSNGGAAISLCQAEKGDILLTTDHETKLQTNIKDDKEFRVSQLSQYDQWGEIIIPADSTFARNTSSSSLRHSRPQTSNLGPDPTVNEAIPFEKDEGSYMSEYAI